MLVHFMIVEHQVSERQACEALRVPRSSYHYEPKAKNDTPVINELQALVSKHPAIGFWQSYFRLRRSGYVWNHKKVYRIYTALHLNIRRRFKKRLPDRVKQALFQPGSINGSEIVST
jgi:putative transposase